MHAGALSHFFAPVCEEQYLLWQVDRLAMPCRMVRSVTRPNPLGFYLWGHHKIVTFTEVVPDVLTLEQRIHAACQAGTFDMVCQSFM